MTSPTSSSSIVVRAVIGGFVLAVICCSAALTNRPAQDVATQTVTAIVVDVRDANGALAGASVRIQGTSTVATTDSKGRVCLLPSGTTGPWHITATHPGFQIGGVELSSDDLHTNNATIRPCKSIQLTRLPARDNPNYEWTDPRPNLSDPTRCGNCHEQIYSQWDESAHARSASNSRFLDLFDGTDHFGNSNVGWNLRTEYPQGAGVCLACHVPSIDPGIEAPTDFREWSSIAKQGTHCDFCHKTADVDLSHVGHNHGRFAFSLLRPATGEKLFFGPLDDVDRGEDVYSPLFRRSEICSSCHEGTLFGIHAYSTYSEWQQSPQARKGIECQTCHMAPNGTMTNIAPGHGGIDRDPATLASHSVPGTSVEFIRSALSLGIELESRGEDCAANVLVRTMNVGHSLPTGHPSRQLILWVRAFGFDGNELVVQTDSRLPGLAGDGGSVARGLAGQPGKLFAKVLEGSDGSQPVPYWRASRIAYDSRLAPDSTDKSTYRVARVPGTVIEATLLYRRFSKDEADTKGWPDNELEIMSVQRVIPVER